MSFVLKQLIWLSGWEDLTGARCLQEHIIKKTCIMNLWGGILLHMTSFSVSYLSVSWRKRFPALLSVEVALFMMESELQASYLAICICEYGKLQDNNPLSDGCHKGNFRCYGILTPRIGWSLVYYYISQLFVQIYDLLQKLCSCLKLKFCMWTMVT